MQHCVAEFSCGLTGVAEQNAADWLSALISVTLELARAVGAERWQAIGLSAMLPTLVLTDDAGAAATPRGTGVPRSGSPRRIPQ